MANYIDIILNEWIAPINPNIYGHFAEHLGACIYEGIWVGEDSPIPNTRGIRNDVVAALKQIRPAVIRWPGGCFADDYHWQDGIGPQQQRPKRINLHWGQVVETNAFGTHEFVRFCRMVGAEPYICGNVGTGTPREMRDWVEYCNFPSGTTWSELRGANGDPDPLNVRYWGVGNENWGCGGSFTPEDYGTEYRRFACFLRAFGDTPIYLIACGPPGNDLDWTRRFFEKLRKDYGRGPAIHSYAAHYYCGTAGTATEYSPEEWYTLLHRASQMEPLVVQQRAAMDAFDPDRAIGLIVDEWGAWHPAEPERTPAFLWQQNTMRDALVAALTLDIFNRHADKVVMSNIAQTINVLQSMILTDGDKMLCTPTYHVYDLYQAHQGGKSVRALFEAPQIAVGHDQLFGLSGSASVKRNELTLTVVNPHVDTPVEVTIRLHGDVRLSRVQESVLAHEDIRAHNTFEEPNRVIPSVREEVSAAGASHVHSFPAASVTRLDITVD